MFFGYLLSAKYCTMHLACMDLFSPYNNTKACGSCVYPHFTEET